MRNGIRGFSLVEVLVATAIVVVALAGLAQVFVIATAANNGSKARTVATILAREKLEDLMASDGNAGGGADFLDARGQWLGEGETPPGGAAYLRRWSVDLLPDRVDGAATLQVWVTLASGGEAARLIGIRTRMRP